MSCPSYMVNRLPCVIERKYPWKYFRARSCFLPSNKQTRARLKQHQILPLYHGPLARYGCTHRRVGCVVRLPASADREQVSLCLLRQHMT